MKTILLTTPYDPGDNDPGKTYDRLSIQDFQLQDDGGGIGLMLRYGYIDNGAFKAGDYVVTKSIRFEDSLADAEAPDPNEVSKTDYTDLKTELRATSNNGANPWDGFLDTLHQYILTSGLVSGTLQA